MSNWFQTARRHPCGVLLAVQIVSIVVYPFLGDQSLGRALFGLIGLLVLGLAVAAVRLTPALTWISIVLGVPLVVLTVLEGVYPHHETIALWSAVVHAAFYLYTGFALIRYMFADAVITVDELFATGATFTVLAWAWAYLYAATQLIWPDSFTAAVDPADQRTWMDLLFLSVTTLTSTGLSDIVPVRPHARSVVMIEQIVGMLYLALVVARITGLTLRPPSGSD
ncbi:ion channel [Nocardioides speluncae]|uniref:ion channel n=1 Tax=Nocardioides speluncae TaxID=2670337 RepID=UPI000D689DE1|nr:ion channel [Nocardioides speluncae]